MVDALATIHYLAQVDGENVEFVLVSSSEGSQSIRHAVKSVSQADVTHTSTYARVTNPATRFQNRAIRLWIVDTDMCQSIKISLSGLRRMAKAFPENDPYCSRPHPEDVKDHALWRSFAACYIATTGSIGSDDMPVDYVAGVEKVFEIRRRPTASSTRSTPSRRSGSLHKWRAKGPELHKRCTVIQSRYKSLLKQSIQPLKTTSRSHGYLSASLSQISPTNTSL